MKNSLFDAFVELREDDTLNIIKDMLKSGEDSNYIAEICKQALIKIGDLFARKEYFLSELVMSGEIFKEVMALLEQNMQIGDLPSKKIGKVLIGTIEGDIHDLGKNIVKNALEGNGFEVYDIGVDVSPDVFVEKVKEIEPDILGMSCLISIGWEALKDTIDALKEAGIRDKVKIILGGGGVDNEVANFAGADAAVKDAIKGVEQCKRWVS